MLPRALARIAAGGPELFSLIAGTRREISMYERHGGAYGYVLYLLRREE